MEMSYDKQKLFNLTKYYLPRRLAWQNNIKKKEENANDIWG